ncbi:hypothetical protein RUM43_005525 [Polyplax serrata]|uniref:Uncharacterized protein n=1 Tax=Polyplax serrata TaxID=468196 RepID=A0AAN8NWW0_POLSC
MQILNEKDLILEKRTRTKEKPVQNGMEWPSDVKTARKRKKIGNLSRKRQNGEQLEALRRLAKGIKRKSIRCVGKPFTWKSVVLFCRLEIQMVARVAVYMLACASNGFKTAATAAGVHPWSGKGKKFPGFALRHSTASFFEFSGVHSLPGNCILMVAL